MLLHLMRKELRESRAAMALGALWMAGPTAFWLRASKLDVPRGIELPVDVASNLAPIACILALTVGRFSGERTRGTWDFLRTHPIPLRKVVLSKWLFAVGAGFFFIVCSAFYSWGALAQLDDRVRQMPVLAWAVYHGCTLSVLMSMLLLLDAIDWGEWQLARALAIGGALVAAFWFTGSRPRVTGGVALLSLAFAGACGAATLWVVERQGTGRGFPWILRRRSTSDNERPARILSPVATLVATQLRQLRVVAAVLASWMVVLVAGFVVAFAVREGGGALDGLHWGISAANWMSFMGLAISGAALGCLGRLMEWHDRAEPMRRTLPIPARMASATRLGSALVLFAVAAAAPFAVQVANDLWIADRSVLRAVTDPLDSLLLAANVLVVSYVAGCTMPRLAPLVALALAVGMVQFVFSAGYPPRANMAVILAVLVAATMVAAPWMERRIEV